MAQKATKWRQGPNFFFRRTILKTKRKKLALLNRILCSRSEDAHTRTHTNTHTHTLDIQTFFFHSITEYVNENCLQQILTE